MRPVCGTHPLRNLASSTIYLDSPSLSSSSHFPLLTSSFLSSPLFLSLSPLHAHSQVVLTEKKIVVDDKTGKVQALISVIQVKTAIANTQQEQASVKQKYAEVRNRGRSVE